METSPQLSQDMGPVDAPLIHETIGALFDRMARIHAGREALVVCHQGIRWTYGGLAERVEALTTGLLSLGLEGGDRVGIWAPNCAGHFMVEAEREGLKTVGRTLPNWLAYQRKAARDWQARQQNGWSIESTQFIQAYRLYVLALAKHPELAAMNRLREQGSLSTRSRWILAAAYAQIGQLDAAKRLTLASELSIPAYSEMGYTYGSALRDEAMIALALMHMDETAKAAGMVQRISKDLSSGGWYSTQSTAFALLAVARFAEKSQLDKGLSFKLELEGKATDRFTEKAISRVELATPS